jgi:hypothetical protein
VNRWKEIEMKEIIEELLFEEESTSLDYKSEQYKFVSASDHEKSELLKDILAFANAWRRTDAYILIGVKEVKGGRAEILGNIAHIDDAQLQQFVNEKTQRPVNFSYIPFEFEGKQIGIIKIGPQDRPIYLQKDYGKIKKNEVYIRRGSSTAIASPDEVLKMGNNFGELYIKEPKLQFGFADIDKLQMIGEIQKIKTTILNIDDEHKIPDYGASKVKVNSMMSMSMPDYTKNKDYLRQLAKFYRDRLYVSGTGFFLFNESGVVATDVNIELMVKNDLNVLTLLSDDDLPSRPNKDYLLNRNFTNISNQRNQISVQRIGVDYLVKIKFDKVQPKQTVYSGNRLFVGATTNVTAPIKMNIYCDNLAQPIANNLSLEVEIEHKSVPYSKFVEEVS